MGAKPRKVNRTFTGRGKHLAPRRPKPSEMWPEMPRGSVAGQFGQEFPFSRSQVPWSRWVGLFPRQCPPQASELRQNHTR